MHGLLGSQGGIGKPIDEVCVNQALFEKEGVEIIGVILNKVLPDKLDFISRAKDAGFFIRLFFVGTDDPSINAKRVAMRVMEGGHDVPIPKIIARYTRSLACCYFAAWLADRTYVYDNSVDDSRARLLFRASEGRLVKTYGEINPWAREIAQRLLPVLSDDTPPSPAVASGLS